VTFPSGTFCILLSKGSTITCCCIPYFLNRYLVSYGSAWSSDLEPGRRIVDVWKWTVLNQCSGLVYYKWLDAAWTLEFIWTLIVWARTVPTFVNFEFRPTWTGCSGQHQYMYFMIRKSDLPKFSLTFSKLVQIVSSSLVVLHLYAVTLYLFGGLYDNNCGRQAVGVNKFSQIFSVNQT
jgi:hypothetical protein